MITITRIKEFIRRQRQIGENNFGDRMRKRYNKTAEEFYSQFADQVYYEKDGEKIGLDIQTLWYFRTKEMIENEKTKTESNSKCRDVDFKDEPSKCEIYPKCNGCTLYR